MRRLVVPALCLFLLPLGCDSSDKDPEAAAKAAQSAAGGLKQAGRLPREPSGPNGPIVGDRDDDVPLPGGRGDVKPPPSVGTATCIVDDGDDAADDPDDTDIKGPGGLKPRGPIGELPDRTNPEVEGATPRSARTRSGAKTRARSADGDAAATTTVKKEPALNWSSICASRMDSDTCNSLCGDGGWDRSAGNEGTCFQTSAATAAEGGTTSVKCGCMCLPGG